MVLEEHIFVSGTLRKVARLSEMRLNFPLMIKGFGSGLLFVHAL